MKIYVDMDGVLANFNQHFYNLYGVEADEYEEVYGTENFWNKVYEDENYFLNIPPYDYAESFFEKIGDFTHHVMILSSPSRENISRCILQKGRWIKNHISASVPMIFESKKYIYACPTSILIDDSKHKLHKWKQRGGIGILHDDKNPDKTLQYLEYYAKTMTYPLNKTKREKFLIP